MGSQNGNRCDGAGFPSRIAVLALIGILPLAGCAGPTMSPPEEEKPLLRSDLPAPARPPLSKGSAKHLRILAGADLSGKNRIAPQMEFPEEQNTPSIEVAVLDRFFDSRWYYAVVEFRNNTPQQGNKNIHMFHYDALGRLVNSSTQVLWFRPYQRITRRYNFDRNSNEVRWIIRVK